MRQQEPLKEGSSLAGCFEARLRLAPQHEAWRGLKKSPIPADQRERRDLAMVRRRGVPDRLRRPG